MYNAIEIIARSSSIPFPTEFVSSESETQSESTEELSITTKSSTTTDETENATNTVSTTTTTPIPRTFTINLKVSTTIPDDMFQTTIRSDQLIIRQLNRQDGTELNPSNNNDTNDPEQDDDDNKVMALDIDNNSFVQIIVPF